MTFQLNKDGRVELRSRGVRFHKNVDCQAAKRKRPLQARRQQQNRPRSRMVPTMLSLAERSIFVRDHNEQRMKGMVFDPFTEDYISNEEFEKKIDGKARQRLDDHAHEFQQRANYWEAGHRQVQQQKIPQHSVVSKSMPSLHQPSGSLQAMLLAARDEAKIDVKHVLADAHKKHQLKKLANRQYKQAKKKVKKARRAAENAAFHAYKCANLACQAVLILEIAVYAKRMASKAALSAIATAASADIVTDVLCDMQHQAKATLNARAASQAMKAANAAGEAAVAAEQTVQLVVRSQQQGNELTELRGLEAEAQAAAVEAEAAVVRAAAVVIASRAKRDVGSMIQNMQVAVDTASSVVAALAGKIGQATANELPSVAASQQAVVLVARASTEAVLAARAACAAAVEMTGASVWAASRAEQLRKWLKLQFKEADADGNGILTKGDQFKLWERKGVDTSSPSVAAQVEASWQAISHGLAEVDYATFEVHAWQRSWEGMKGRAPTKEGSKKKKKNKNKKIARAAARVALAVT